MSTQLQLAEPVVRLRPIQGVDGYMISQTGHVWSSKTRRWRRAHTNKGNGYLQVGLFGINAPRYIHKLVMQAWGPEKPSSDMVIDHINRDRQDNRICNLRWTTCARNSFNATKRKQRSGHRGVHQINNGQWQARFNYDKVRHYAGTFWNKEDAIRAHAAAVAKLVKE